MKVPAAILWLAPLLVLLAACGGGGADGQPPPRDTGVDPDRPVVGPVVGPVVPDRPDPDEPLVAPRNGGEPSPMVLDEDDALGLTYPLEVVT